MKCDAPATYRSYDSAHLKDHSRRTEATCIYDHMVANAEERFDGKKDVRLIEIRGLKLWLFGDHTAIRFKKMDEDGRSRNYPTKQAQAFDNNEQLQGLPPLPTRISVGYFLDVTAQGVERVQVARPNGKHVDWCAAIVPVEMRESPARLWEEITKQVRFG